MKTPRPVRHYRFDSFAPIRWVKQAITEGIKCYGHMDPLKGSISISTKFPPSVQAWTLLHEFLHEVYSEWGEEMVRDGENRIGDHIVLNRKAWEWIIENIGDERPKVGGKR